MIYQFSHRHKFTKSEEVLKIKPLFDLHKGNTLCDVDAVKDYLSDTDKNTVIIGGGDLMDSIITSDLKRYNKDTDDTDGQAIIDAQIKDMYKVLKPYQSHILGLGTGNHEENILLRCGTSPTGRLAEMLGVPELGYSWLYRIFLQFQTQVRVLTIRGHHGWGGGSRTQGADLTKYSRDVAYWDADLFLYGHGHRRQSDEIPRLGLSKSGELVARPKAMVLCGTFLKTFTEGVSASYSEKAGYPPVTIGSPLVTVSMTREWFDIKVIT